MTKRGLRPPDQTDRLLLGRSKRMLSRMRLSRGNGALMRCPPRRPLKSVHVTVIVAEHTPLNTLEAQPLIEALSAFVRHQWVEQQQPPPGPQSSATEPAA